MENQQSKLIEREQLYEQVWSKPMIKLSAEYGLSDNGVRKICKKLNIPLPKSGYWQKLKHGKAPKRPELPPTNSLAQAIIQKKEQLVVKQIDEPPEILAEYLPKNRIKVHSTLDKPHRLIVSLRDKLRDSYNYSGMVTGSRNDLDVRIGKGSINRALRLMDALLKALESRNMQVIIKSQDQYETQVRCLGKTVRINLYEKTKIKLKEEDKYGYVGRDFIPTGEFVLQLERYCYGPKCRDGQRKKLEDCLNDFVIKIYREVFKQKAWEIEREDNQKRELERYRQAEEEKKKEELERQKIQSLEKDASNWQKSKIIKSYIEELKKLYIEKNDEIKPESEFGQWVSWANKHIESLNPLGKYQSIESNNKAN